MNVYFHFEPGVRAPCILWDAITIISYSDTHITMTAITAILCNMEVYAPILIPIQFPAYGQTTTTKLYIYFLEENDYYYQRKKSCALDAVRFDEKSIEWRDGTGRDGTGWHGKKEKNAKIIFIRTWKVLLNVCDSVRIQEPRVVSIMQNRRLMCARTTTVFIVSSLMRPTHCHSHSLPPTCFQVQYLPFDIPLNYKMRMRRNAPRIFSNKFLKYHRWASIEWNDILCIERWLSVELRCTMYVHALRTVWCKHYIIIVILNNNNLHMIFTLGKVSVSHHPPTEHREKKQTWFAIYTHGAVIFTTHLHLMCLHGACDWYIMGIGEILLNIDCISSIRENACDDDVAEAKTCENVTW